VGAWSLALLVARSREPVQSRSAIATGHVPRGASARLWSFEPCGSFGFEEGLP